jgi:5-methylcytosine-specific restriction endonuclease McrA
VPKNRTAEKLALVRRDGPSCFYCGRHRRKPLLMTIEHLQPRAAGGSNRLENLKLADVLCNKLAGSLSVEAKLDLRARWHMAEGL